MSRPKSQPSFRCRPAHPRQEAPQGRQEGGRKKDLDPRVAMIPPVVGEDEPSGEKDEGGHSGEAVDGALRDQGDHRSRYPGRGDLRRGA